MAAFEEVVIRGRKRDFVTDESMLAELRSRGFEPQVVGEIDPPPRHGGSWVLRDKRDRRAHEDGGVWIAWTRPREAPRDLPTRYVIETFDGRSGWDWYLALALAQAIVVASSGRASVDGAAEQDATTFLADLARDPATSFRGTESVVDWEAAHLEEGEVEEDDEDYEGEDDEGETAEELLEDDEDDDESE